MSCALILDTQDLPDRSSGTLAVSCVGLGFGRQKLWKDKGRSVGGSINYTNLSPYFSLVKQSSNFTHKPEYSAMKKLLSITAICLFTFAVQAQTASEKYVKAMEKALSGLDSLKTSEQWLMASNNFERIAQKETKAWLPPYYVAFCQTMAFNLSQDKTMYELLAKRADEFVAKADALNPDNSEIYVLKNMISGLYIRINPMVNGQKYGPLAGMQLEKAKKLESENPRAYMQEGAILIFTPAQWGGDKAKGKATLEMAAVKYEAFKSVSSIYPNWGKKTNDMFLEMANK